MPPAELEQRRAAGEPLRLIDLREAYEIEAGAPVIPGAERLPLSQICQWWPELDPGAELVFQCNTGRRSRALCRVLAVHGFRHVWDLEGGIEAWLDARSGEIAAET